MIEQTCEFLRACQASETVGSKETANANQSQPKGDGRDGDSCREEGEDKEEQEEKDKDKDKDREIRDNPGKLPAPQMPEARDGASEALDALYHFLVRTKGMSEHLDLQNWVPQCPLDAAKPLFTSPITGKSMPRNAVYEELLAFQHMCHHARPSPP